MPSSTVIADNIHQIRQKIVELATKYDRSAANILLLAVSKTRSLDELQTAYDAGQRAFGENYLQEALHKIQSLDHPDIEWHFIGAIQSNKTRDIAQAFQWVHSIDRVKIANRLSEQRNPDLPPLNICLQINICDETTKSGISLERLPQIAMQVARLPNLKLRGLMAIPAKTDSLPEQRAIFRQMKQALNHLNEQGLSLDTLSMGMTNDMEAAIAEGATIVRIGTAIFGPRTYNKSQIV